MMGVQFSNFYYSLTARRDICIIVQGLRGAGKTTILGKVKLNRAVASINNSDFNVELVEYKRMRFALWEIGIRDLWYHCSNSASAVIFVIDSSDCALLKEVKKELHYILSHRNLRNAVVLIFANKQDLPLALDIKELSKRLELHQIKNVWYIQPTCGISGRGINEGLQHLYKMLKNKTRRAVK